MWLWEFALVPEKQSENRRKHGAEHLEPHWFKPGHSGNPNGRPKGQSIEALVRAILDEKIEGKIDGEKVSMTKREAIARMVIAESIKGKERMTIELLKREWPEVTRHELSGPDGNPIALEDARGRLAGKLSRLAASLSGDEVPTEPRPNGSGDPRA